MFVYICHEEDSLETMRTPLDSTELDVKDDSYSGDGDGDDTGGWTEQERREPGLARFLFHGFWFGLVLCYFSIVAK